jgi:hypothetical protein
VLDSFAVAIWQVLLRLLTQLHELSEHAAIDAAFFDRENANLHYCRRTDYCVQTLKATALVNTDTQAVLLTYVVVAYSLIAAAASRRFVPKFSTRA